MPVRQRSIRQETHPPSTWTTYTEVLDLYTSNRTSFTQYIVKYTWRLTSLGFKIKIRWRFEGNIWRTWQSAITDEWDTREHWITANRPTKSILHINGTIHTEVATYLHSAYDLDAFQSSELAVDVVEHIRENLQTLSDPLYEVPLASTPTTICGICDETISAIHSRSVRLLGDETPTTFCSNCWEEYDACYRCGFAIQEDNTIWSSTTDEPYCEDCYRSIPRILGYSYKPNPDFRPPTPTEPKKPFYIGMELETEVTDGLTCNDKEVAQWINSVQELQKGLIYAKADVSIRNGVEFVTHPFEPRWGLKHFPFDSFGHALEKGLIMETHPSCGTHVHVSKAAFTSAHLWKFLQVHLKLADFVGMVGGRGIGEDYGYLGDGYTKQQLKKKAMAIAKTKGDLYAANVGDSDRSFGINLWPSATIELRYPRGGATPYEIKKNIEWVECLFEFTDYLNIADVREGAINDPGYLMGYIYDDEEKYPNLADWVDKRSPRPKQLTKRNE